jgi:hypothetical protein
VERRLRLLLRRDSVLKKLNILSGRYGNVHVGVDMHHLTMGLDLCEPAEPSSPTGLLYHRVLWHSACLYHQTLGYRVGERVEPLQLLPSHRDGCKPA